MPADDKIGFVRTGIACRDCRKESMWPVRRLLALDTISCRFCGTEVDLRPQHIHLAKIAERYRDVDTLFGETNSESGANQ